MTKYKCIGCGEVYNYNDYSEEDGDILIEDKSFCLADKKQDTNKSTPRFHRFAYSQEDVKEAVRRLKEFIEADVGMERSRLVLFKHLKQVFGKELTK